MLVEYVVIGNIVKETIVRIDGVLGPVLGSPCAYTGLALATMGKRVGMVSYYGEDFLEKLNKDLRSVDTKGCIEYLHTTENHLIYTNDEQNRVEYFRVAPMINYDIIDKDYLDAKVFFVCPMAFEVNIDVLKELSYKKKTVITDIGGFGGTTAYNHFSISTKRGKKLIDDLCKYSSIVKASHDDLFYLFPDMTVEECIEYIISRGPSVVVITMGADGAVYQQKGSSIHYLPACHVEGKPNLTGGGDVFAAAMISRFNETEDIDDAVYFGNAAAALALEKPGGCIRERMPSEAMIIRKITSEKELGGMPYARD